MDMPFDKDDGDDFDDGDFDGDSDGDGFSDAYEELIGSDPHDPTDLPFDPIEIIDSYPRKKKKIIIPEEKEKETPQSILIEPRSETRNKCVIFFILFIIFLVVTPFMIYLALS
jgi:hypothetical protein